jgi:dodecin
MGRVGQNGLQPDVPHGEQLERDGEGNHGKVVSLCPFIQEPSMSVAKVTEITSTSTKSFEDAMKSGISRATKTLKNVKGAWISEQKIEIENNKIKTYRVDMKVTFVLTD